MDFAEQWGLLIRTSALAPRLALATKVWTGCWHYYSPNLASSLCCAISFAICRSYCQISATYGSPFPDFHPGRHRPAARDRAGPVCLGFPRSCLSWCRKSPLPWLLSQSQHSHAGPKGHSKSCTYSHRSVATSRHCSGPLRRESTPGRTR